MPAKRKAGMRFVSVTSLTDLLNSFSAEAWNVVDSRR